MLRMFGWGIADEEAAPEGTADKEGAAPDGTTDEEAAPDGTMDEEAAPDGPAERTTTLATQSPAVMEGQHTKPHQSREIRQHFGLAENIVDGLVLPSASIPSDGEGKLPPERLTALKQRIVRTEVQYNELLKQGYFQPPPSAPARRRNPELTSRAPGLKAKLPKEATPTHGRSPQRKSASPSVTRRNLALPIRTGYERRFGSPPKPYWQTDRERPISSQPPLQVAGVVTQRPQGTPPACEFDEWLATASAVEPLYDVHRRSAMRDARLACVTGLQSLTTSAVNASQMEEEEPELEQQSEALPTSAIPLPPSRCRWEVF